ncbi:hypothetical protein Tco_1214913 [Tanacetum coccineum]
MTRSSTKKLLSPFENLEPVLLSRRKLFETPSLAESSSPESGVARPIIDADIQFELKGQFLKELRDNTFSGGAIPTKTVANAKTAIQEMAEYS